MSRYMYYLIFVTMIANIIATVPRILVFESKKGVIFSMIAALFVGVILTYFVVLFFNKFSGQSLPDFLKKYSPKWFYIPVIVYFAVTWFLAGTITLITYVFLFTTFVSLETSLLITALAFVIVVSFGLLMKSESVLYTLEVVFILLLPILLFLFIKIITDENLEWDFVKVAMMNINTTPSYSAFTAASYQFIGVVNIVIFNSFFKEKLKIGFKQISIISIVGAIVIFITYFIPIGFNGFEQIDHMNFPWVSTSDSVRMKFGVIERVVFIFIIIFLGISFLSLLIHWHVSLKLLESVFYFNKMKWKDKNLTSYFFVLLFGVISIYLVLKINEYELFKFTSNFYNTLPIFYFILFLSLFVAKRRAKG
ncbi:GerAB/ArcD/ProY family transporter [Psychrobacillus sp. NPDC096623]|uniref:GerAB/ArcD/ProY family transporter n=1 Tax=Psychrobacillus sp. NPDC096623 TaxID=3364492 RepID=UPI003806F438